MKKISKPKKKVKHVLNPSTQKMILKLMIHGEPKIIATKKKVIIEGVILKQKISFHVNGTIF